MKKAITRWLCLVLCGIATTSSAQLDSLINTPGVSFSDILNVIKSDSTNTADTSEGGGRTKIDLFDMFWRKRTSVNDSSGQNMFTKYFSALAGALPSQEAAGKSTQASSCTQNGFSGNWTCIGPNRLPFQAIGYVQDIWADPDQGDEGHVLVATPGGVFETNNVNATPNTDVEWHCLTDNTTIVNGIINPSSLAVKPDNNDVIYCGTSAEAIVNQDILGLGYSWSYGAGMLKSLDGGQTWQQEVINTGSASDPFQRIQKVYFSPDGSRLFAFMGNRIFTKLYTTNNWNTILTTWTELNTTNINNGATLTYNATLGVSYGIRPNAQFLDLDFVPGSNTHFFTCTGSIDGLCDAAVYEWKWVTNAFVGVNITKATNFNLLKEIPFTNPQSMAATLVVGSETYNNYLRWAVSVPNANEMYAVVLAINNYPQQPGSVGLIKYDISNQQFTTVKRRLFGGTSPSSYVKACMEFIVSPNNNDNMYFASMIPKFFWEGTIVEDDGWPGCVDIGCYDPQPLCHTHGDIRAMVMRQSSSTTSENDEVFLATDGGVSRKKIGVDLQMINAYDDGTEDISGKYLATATVWGIATSEKGGYLVGGAQHDGIYAYEPDKDPAWAVNSNQGRTSDGKKPFFNNVAGSNLHDAFCVTNHMLDNEFARSSPAGGRTIGSWTVNNTFPTGSSNGIWDWMSDAHHHYAGRYEFCKRTSGTGNWFDDAGTVALLTGHQQGNNINSMALVTNPDAQDSPVGYVCYNYDDRLRVKEPGQSDFSQLTALIPGSSNLPVNAITLDELHPERVWVAMGGISPVNGTDANYRVFYSDDWGVNWHDISVGLPLELPVTAIVHRTGTNEVYCATDVGIYRCDLTNFSVSATNTQGGHTYNTSVQWLCFNQGQEMEHPFPNAFVTGLSINYCTGKLYASTYGRSFWATDLFPVADPPHDLIIANNNPVVWTGDIYLTHDVTVATGHTLQIGDGSTPTTVHMAKGSRIFVDEEATLDVNNAKITNGCGYMWEGIIADGNQYAAQDGFNQANVIIRNNSVIEHARIAVANRWAHAGAIIKASNSTFLNNAVGAYFNPYHNYNTNGPLNNQSRFDGCTFKIDESFRGDNLNAPFYSHVVMYEVEGIPFTGCNFYNVKQAAPKHEGYGIKAYNAAFFVRPFCSMFGSCTPYYFSGFRSAIDIDGSMNIGFTTAIDYAQFDTCSMGIYISKLDNITATRNVFTIGNGNPIHQLSGTCNQNFGIFTRNSSMFDIRENVFNGTLSEYNNNDWDNFGLAISNSGAPDKIVYKNTFFRLRYGSYAYGQNRNTTPGLSMLGLHFHCNVYNNNKNDLFVAAGSTQGIASQQGSYSGYPAGNAFNSTLMNINNTASLGFTYFHGGTVPSTVNGNITFIQSQNSNHCPSSFGGITDYIVKGHVVNSLSSSFRTAKQDFENDVTDLLASIDNGSTEDMLEYLDTKSVSDSDDVYNHLTSASPFVSEEVLRAMVDENELSRRDQMDILTANPVPLRNQAFLEYLENLANPFTTTQLNALTTAARTICGRSTLENDVLSARINMMDVAQTWLRDMLALDDTVSWDTVKDDNIYDIDSVAFILNSINEPWAQYDLAGLYFLLGDETSAESVLSGISTASFSTTQLEEYNNYLTIYEILKDIRAEGRDTLTPVEDSILNEIGGYEYENNAKAGASNLAGNLGDLGSPVVLLPCAEFYVTGRPKSPKPLEPISGYKKDKAISAAPNPASDNVKFTYDVPAANGALQLVITTAHGQVITKLDLAGSKGTYNWSTGNTAPGTYIYKLSDTRGVISTGKLVIVK